MYWYIAVWRNWLDFSGRARRKEFWVFTLINILVSLVLAIADSVIGVKDHDGTGVLDGIYSICAFIPSLSVNFRRLHDIGRSAWWLLLAFLPIIGWIVLFVFSVMDSQPGPNRYGPNPKFRVG
jgi:uncharacterized membrane protein YhaH (DUF805 family)